MYERRFHLRIQRNKFGLTVNPKFQRRSAISKYTLIGDTPIPAELGSTITGAIANLYVDAVSVIIYSAANDTVTFTDNKGTHQVTTDSTGRSDPIQIAVSTISPVTFTSSVAKNPNNLSVNYTKSVAIYSTTTSVYVMPDGYIVYWYGYHPHALVDSASAGSGLITYDTNNLSVQGAVSTSTGGFYTNSAINLADYTTLKDIASYTLAGLSTAYYGSCRIFVSKSVNAGQLAMNSGVKGSGALQLRSSAIDKSQYTSGYWAVRYDSSNGNYPVDTIYAAWLE